jgi:hypothetical protein
MNIKDCLLSLVVFSSLAFAGVNPVATPEPASIGMMAVGLGGVAFVAWKRRRR